MRFVLVGDIHLRSRPPIGRIEQDFISVQLDKLQQILNIARQYSCDYILQAGDFFDRPDPSNLLIANCVNLLKTSSIPIICVAGQHDMIGHSLNSIDRSPLNILHSAEVLYLSKEEAIEYNTDCSIYGASFGQEIPIPTRKDRYNILITHRMIGTKDLFPGQNIERPKSFVRKYPHFDLVLCGDNHTGFAKFIRRRNSDFYTFICNPGAITRLTRSKRDLELKPKVIIYNSEDDEVTEVWLKVKPANEVFDMENISEDKEDNMIEEFVNKLKESGNVGIDFGENLQAFYKAHNTPQSIRNRISHVQESIVKVQKL